MKSTKTTYCLVSKSGTYADDCYKTLSEAKKRLQGFTGRYDYEIQKVITLRKSIK